MQTRNNLAYDLKRFETRPQPKTRPQVKVVRQQEQARRTRNLIAQTAVCITIFFVGIIGIIFSQVAITEVTMDITNKTQKLEQLQSEIAMELTRAKISVDKLTLRQQEGFLSVLPVGRNQQHQIVFQFHFAGLQKQIAVPLTEKEKLKEIGFKPPVLGEYTAYLPAIARIDIEIGTALGLAERDMNQTLRIYHSVVSLAHAFTFSQR